MQASSAISLSPSFNAYSSSRLTEIAARVVEECRGTSENDGIFYSYSEKLSPDREQDFNTKPQEKEENGHRDEEEEDFEFSFVKETDSSSISADDIFYNGQIRPVFPVFNRDLLLDDVAVTNAVSKPHRLPLGKLFNEERERGPSSSSSSEADELDGLPAETYCVWTPKAAADQSSPGRCKKSNSTGSSKRWKFRDLLHRSNSDGKDTFVFLTPSASTKAKKKDDKESAAVDVKVAEKSRSKRATGGDGVTSVHDAYYVPNRAIKEGDRRRSYLPYKQDLMGFFSNVNGLNRNLQPF